MTTVICHFYNEEYLLPFWLEHHKNIFDHGIMIDYASTDKSVEIIKEICPTWQVVPSVNEYFDAALVDVEVENWESMVTGLKMALNVTEFLFGDYSIIKEYDEPTQILIPGWMAIDKGWETFDDSKPLLEQVDYGIPYDVDQWASCRSLHNFDLRYPSTGRHFHSYNTDKLIFIKLLYFPMNDRFLDRKLQIQTKQGKDFGSDRGYQHHNHGKGLTKETLLEWWQEHLTRSIDIKERLNTYR